MRFLPSKWNFCKNRLRFCSSKRNFFKNRLRFWLSKRNFSKNRLRFCLSKQNFFKNRLRFWLSKRNFFKNSKRFSPSKRKGAPTVLRMTKKSPRREMCSTVEVVFLYKCLLLNKLFVFFGVNAESDVGLRQKHRVAVCFVFKEQIPVGDCIEKNASDALGNVIHSVQARNTHKHQRHIFSLLDCVLKCLLR